jgi:hypothetical protein
MEAKSPEKPKTQKAANDVRRPLSRRRAGQGAHVARDFE